MKIETDISYYNILLVKPKFLIWFFFYEILKAFNPTSDLFIWDIFSLKHFNFSDFHLRRWRFRVLKDKTIKLIISVDRYVHYLMYYNNA